MGRSQRSRSITSFRAGGTNDPSNLALTCPHCNAHKWTAATGSDPETGEIVALFNPRADYWSEHFTWAEDGSGALLGTTARGCVTVAALRINDANMLALCVLLAELGLFPEVAGT